MDDYRIDTPARRVATFVVNLVLLCAVLVFAYFVVWVALQAFWTFDVPFWVFFVALAVLIFLKRVIG